MEQQQRLAGLGQIGQQQQQLQQMGLQVPYEEFQRALAYGPQQFGLLAAGQGVTKLQRPQHHKKQALGDILGSCCSPIWYNGSFIYGLAFSIR